MEAVNHNLTTAAVFGNHVVNVLTAVFKCRNRTVLCRNVGTEHNVLMQNVHSVDDCRRCHDIAKTQAGHSVGLGEAVENNGAVAEFREVGEHGVRFAAVGKMSIKLVADDNQVVLYSPVTDSLNLFLAHNSAGRVIGVTKHNSLGLGRNSLFQIFNGRHKAVFLISFYGNRLAACQNNASLVGNVAGLGQNNFITGMHNRSNSGVQCFADTDGYHDFGFRIIFHAVVFMDIIRNCLAQLQKAERRSVAAFAFADAVDFGILDSLRNIKIGFAYAERHDVGVSGHNIKKLCQTGGRQCFNKGRNSSIKIIGHKKTTFHKKLVDKAPLSKLTLFPQSLSVYYITVADIFATDKGKRSVYILRGRFSIFLYKI